MDLHNLTALIQVIAVSAAEADVGSLFVHVKRVKLFVSFLTKLDIPNHLHQFTLIITLPLELQMTQ